MRGQTVYEEDIVSKVKKTMENREEAEEKETEVTNLSAASTNVIKSVGKVSSG